MSMNFSEFKKLIGADPLNQDHETVQARNSAPEFEAAAAEAGVFEEKLQAALNIQPPTDLLAEIKGISQTPAKKSNWVPLAMAASLVVVVGAAGIVWKQTHTWDSVEAYVADHYSHDGSSVVAKASEAAPAEDIIKIMARLGATADQQLASRIRFIKHCPTPDGRGAHMVVVTDQGLMTIIFMPEVQVNDGEVVEFDQTHALLVDLGHGSAAIIGDMSQSLDSMGPLVRESIKTS
jgi:hypothetical protein